MKLNLKQGLVLLLLTIILWCGFFKSQNAANLSTDPQIIHLLDRLSFGASPGDIELVTSQGIKTYIQSQLSPASISQSPQFLQRIQQWENLEMTPVELWQEYSPRPVNANRPLVPEERKQRIRRIRKIARKSIQANLFGAIANPRQLEEVMVDFWFNHFNIYIAKGTQERLWLGDYVERAIRPHVFANFRDLLAATARHPAMLHYLDNWLNTVPNYRKRGRFKGLNENYARELMELHTLGVDGGYTQEDVIALARILTGWGIDPSGRKGDQTGFYFDANRHDYGDKVFLGKSIPGSGMPEVEKALDILANHPATAHHISYKLAQYFIADEPPSNLVEKLANKFLATDGNIRAVLATLFNSPEFFAPKYYDKKFKTPYQYLISLARATGTDNPNLMRIMGMLRQLSMVPYHCPTPNGYKNTQSAWLNPDAMLKRVSFATAIANGSLAKNQRVGATKLNQTLGNSFSANTQEVINSSPRRLRSAIMLGSPEMMYK